MSNKLKYSLLGLLLTATVALGGDLLIKSRGDIIFESGGSYVQVKKPLKVDSIKNLDGTDAPPGGVPVGSVVAVVPNLHANLWQPPATGAIKDGFMRADGNTVPSCSDCVIPAGTVLPNMVGDYVRGGTSSGGVTTHASEMLSTTTLPAITTPSIPTGGQVDINGTAAVHRHTADHSHVTSVTASTHTHAMTHTHSYSLNAASGPHIIDSENNPGTHYHPGPTGPAGHSISREQYNASYASVVFTFANSCGYGSCYAYNGTWMAWTGGGHLHTNSTTNGPSGGGANHTHLITHGAVLPAVGPTGYVSADHTHAVSNYTGTPVVQSQSHDHTFTSMTVGSGSTPISLELAYVQVVWIIRVR